MSADGLVAARRTRSCGTTLVLAVGFGLVEVLCRREALHGFDALLALHATQSGIGAEAGHFLYYPLARAFRGWLQPFGVDAFTAMGWLSAVGVALAVAFAHRVALALRFGRRAPWLAVALGVTPAVTYFGATVEVDALVLGGASVAWWTMVRLLRRPRALGGVLLGLSTGTVACLHGGGQLLLGSILALAGTEVLRRWRNGWTCRARCIMRGLAFAVVVHAGLYVAAALLSGREGQGAMVANTQLLRPSLGRLPATFWNEWLVPYAPWSLCWVGLARRSRWRWRGRIATLGLVWGAYLLLTNAVMAYFEPAGPVLWERGAFFVTLALPTVVLAFAWCPRGWQGPTLAATAVLALWFVRRDDWTPLPASFDRDVHELLATGPTWIYCDAPDREYGWLCKVAAEAGAFAVSTLPRELADHERNGALAAEHVAFWFDQRMAAARAAGARVVVTTAALAWLRGAEDARLRGLATSHLASNYRLEATSYGGLEVWSVTSR